MIPMDNNWILTFEDDFNGTTLDTTKWHRCPEQRRQDVGGWWKDSQSFLDGKGHLVLKASISEDGTPISGAIHSKGLFEQAYGYFECRMKMQRTSGFWGAFWLMTEQVRNVTGTAVDGAEIDIIESGEFPRMGVNHAIHWDGYGKDITDETDFSANGGKNVINAFITVCGLVILFCLATVRRP